MSVRDRAKTGLVMGVSIVGCGTGPVPPPQPRPRVTQDVTAPPAPTSRPPRRSRHKAALDRLRADAVYTNHVGRTVLYSWTTAEQVAGLHRDKVLLTRTRSPTKGLAQFDRTLRALQDPVSRLLMRDGWNRRRFAWSSPWPTIAGWPHESYGDQLIEIRLRPDAWIGVLVSDACSPGARARWRFVDAKDRPVPESEVLAKPERLAAVYHQSTADPRGALAQCGGTFASPTVPFREYVIVREEMVARWAMGTEELRKTILTSRASLRAVQSALETVPRSYAGPDLRSWARGLNTKVWPAKSAPETPRSLYEGNLTWGNELYVPTAYAIENIITRLRAAARGQKSPLVHAPDPAQLRIYWQRHRKAKPAPAVPGNKRRSRGGGTF